MAKKTLDQCRSGKDFVKYAERKGASVTNGKGSHHKVKNDRGMCIVPVHNKDLANGTRSSIMKTFVKMGLMVLIVAAVLPQLIGG